jgi:predicted metalloprotease with PDZ domain
VKESSLILMLVAVFAAGGVPAQGVAGPVYTAIATNPPPSTDTAGSPDDNSKLEAQLEAARKRLEDAAHEVAELSARMGGPVIQKFMAFNDEPGQAIIGVQLDPASGKDGARVREVSPGGPAAEAGIRAGDVIVVVNGTDVKGEDTARQVIKIMRDVRPESKVTVRVLREGKARDFTIVARPEIGNMAFARGLPDLPSFGITTAPGLPGLNPPFMIRGALADMELATLTPKLGRYFGTDKGVLVVRAPADEAFKLEDGDVILSIDGREPTSGSHATRILASYQPGEKIAIRIMRDHKSLNVETKLPDNPGRPRKMVILRDGKELAPQNVVVFHGAEEGT